MTKKDLRFQRMINYAREKGKKIKNKITLTQHIGNKLKKNINKKISKAYKQKHSKREKERDNKKSQKII